MIPLTLDTSVQSHVLPCSAILAKINIPKCWLSLGKDEVVACSPAAGIDGGFSVPKRGIFYRFICMSLKPSRVGWTCEPEAAWRLVPGYLPSRLLNPADKPDLTLGGAGNKLERSGNAVIVKGFSQHLRS